MALRAWRVWGMSAVLAGGMVAVAQGPKTEVSGRATPTITQDFHEPVPAPPRLLPQQVRDPKPSGTAPPTAGPSDLNQVVGLTAATEAVGGPRWKARAALEVAEMYFQACETADARNWYEEVIKLAPRSAYAAVAAERLKQTAVIPAGGQSSEPPLADAIPSGAQARIR